MTDQGLVRAIAEAMWNVSEGYTIEDVAAVRGPDWHPDNADDVAAKALHMGHAENVLAHLRAQGWAPHIPVNLMLHKDGTVTMNWPEGAAYVSVSRQLVEIWVARHNCILKVIADLLDREHNQEFVDSIRRDLGLTK